jgi:two-component system, cell cycle sensor histidine kinase and response regulator CckA
MEATMGIAGKILIVDDEQRLRDSLKFLVEREGYSVKTAGNGLQAIQMVNQERFDLCLLDICMPEMGGFELMEKILSQQPDALLVMMTGQASIESAVSALKKGAHDFLRKPFDDTDLLKTIKNALTHKDVRERLKRTRIKYKYMVENSPDLIYQLDEKAHFTFINQAVNRLLEYSPTELIGQHYTSIVFPDDRKKAEWLFNERRTGERATAGVELRLLCNKDASTCELTDKEFITVELKATGMYEDINSAAKTKRFAGTYGVARDISYRKQLEIHLNQSQKMEAIGTLAGGIAHDFNNLLMGIQGYTSLMLADTELTHRNHGRLMHIEEHVQSGAELTRQLLDFSRGGKYDLRSSDINHLVKKTAVMFGRTKKEIKIKLDLAENLWFASVDRGQIQQVILNLYVNAWQAMPKGGRIDIRTANVELYGQEAIDMGLQKTGRFIEIFVKDTGIGIAKELLNRIFEPFFTTKERGRGTGLGLASSYGIINNHGGTIKVYSEKGKGTQFVIYLPATTGSVHEEKIAPGKIKSGKGTILLVDDEINVIDVTEEMLQSVGYKVLTARSGMEAIDLFRQNRADIRLIILDMVMPGLGGGETFDCIKTIDPNIRVLLSSGYSLKGEAKEILDRGCNGFIQKPYTLAQLSEKLNEIAEVYVGPTPFFERQLSKVV